MTDHVARPFPLSPAQEYLWETVRFKSLGKPLLSRENPFISLELRGPLDVAALRAALQSLTDRHESLRTTLSDLGSRPFQRVHPTITAPVSFIDVTGVPDERRGVVTESLVASVRDGTFDMLTGPLWECQVVRVGPETHVVSFAFCHLVIDGTSLAEFLDQLGALYAGDDLPPQEMQYRHYVDLAWSAAQVTEQKLDFWRRRLAPLPSAVPLPTDHPPSSFARSLTNHAFRSPLAGSEVRSLCRSLNATPYLLNAAAYAAAIAAMAERPITRLVFASSVARLDLKQDVRMIGCFLDCLFFAVSVDEDCTLGELVAHVRGSFEDGRNNMVPWPQLARAVYPGFDDRRPVPGMCVYDVWMRGRIFDSGTGPNDVVVRLGDVAAVVHATETRSGHAEFTHKRHAEEARRFHVPLLYLNSVDGTEGYLRYDRTLYGRQTIQRLSTSHQEVLRAMVQPGTSVGDAGQRAFAQARRAHP